MADVSGLASMTQDQFITLFLAGLKNQDPMQPVDSQTFLQQISQFANLQGMQNLTASFSDMLKLQQLTQGSTLIGWPVQYTVNGTSGSGTVSNLMVQNGQILLQVGSAQVGLDQITRVGSA